MAQGPCMAASTTESWNATWAPRDANKSKRVKRSVAILPGWTDNNDASSTGNSNNSNNSSNSSNRSSSSSNNNNNNTHTRTCPI